MSEAMFDPFEYLVLRHKDGLLKTDFKSASARFRITSPAIRGCRTSDRRRARCCNSCRDTTVNTVERCSGHDGTWGVKTEYFANSMKIGRPVFKAMGQNEPDYISSDCAMAARHIEQGMGEGAGNAERQHPLSLLVNRLRTLTEDTMQAMPKIARDSLMTLEAYSRGRKDFRAKVMAHKRNRKVHLGDHVTLIFEDELTIRYQVQEMLRVERIFEEDGIDGELEAYNPAHPGRPQLQGDDDDRVPGRRRAQGRARAAEGGRGPRLGAGRGLPEGVTPSPTRTSSARTTRRPRRCTSCASSSTDEMAKALQYGVGLAIGIDHPAYQAALDPVPLNIRNSLAADLA